MHLTLTISLYREAHLRVYSSENMHFFILASYKQFLLDLRCDIFYVPEEISCALVI